MIRLLLSACLWLPAALCAQQLPASAPTRTVNYDESQAGAYPLPDPLLLPGGRRIVTPKQWEAGQRTAVLNLFKQHVYGQLPGSVAGTRHIVQRVDSAALGGRAVRTFTRILFGPGDDAPHMDVMTYLPTGKQAVPVFVTLNYGNHTLSDDPTIPLPTHSPGTERPKRGAFARRWPIESLLDAGFGLAVADYGDLEPDEPNGWQRGIRTTLQPQTGLKPEQWSAIGAWAWGLSRLADYLLTNPAVDPGGLIVQGHSRLGKAALWAGANDRRFALVISNESGEGGAALARRNYGETIRHITEAFPHWFVPAYRTYAARPAALPVDQHELLALVAPRALYVCSAAADRWADPRGEFLSLQAAAPLWGLYGQTPVLGTFPAVDQPIRSGPLGYHIRSGPHDVTPFDWAQYIAHARAVGLAK